MTIDRLLHWANVGYMAALLIAAFFSIAVYQLSKRVTDAKDRELEQHRTQSEVNIAAAQAQSAEAIHMAETERRARAELESQVAAAEARAAEANRAASEAQLELARITEPRTIAPEDQQTLIARLRQFEGQRYDLTVFADNESQNLLWSIYRILNEAGWVYTNAHTSALEAGISVRITEDLKVRASPHAGLRASMQSDLRLDSTTARALAALKIGIEEAGLEFSAGFRHVPLENVPADLIVLSVGEKRVNRNRRKRTATGR